MTEPQPFRVTELNEADRLRIEAEVAAAPPIIPIQGFVRADKLEVDDSVLDGDGVRFRVTHLGIGSVVVHVIGRRADGVPVSLDLAPHVQCDVMRLVDHNLER